MPSKKKKPESGPKAPEKTAPEKQKWKIDDKFPIVGIGASAGGLETLGAFFPTCRQRPALLL